MRTHHTEAGTDGSPQDELNESDRQARRLLDIVLTLLASPVPVSSTRLRELHYPNSQPDSFRKLFSRDRKRLALCGITVRRANRPPDEPVWQIDEDSSFSKTAELTPREAVVLDVACSQLASDPTFPLSNDLRMALAKLDKLFDRSYPAGDIDTQVTHDRRATAIEDCLLERHAADITYRTQDGTDSKRRIAPYGMFTLRSNAYVVGPLVGESGLPQPGSIRTYRIDRIISLAECKRITYVIPKDFDVHDYVLLPFQVGKHLYYAYFVTSCSDSSSLTQYDAINTSVVLTPDGKQAVRVSVSDEQLAAGWAISEGLIPLGPVSLVDTWKRMVVASLESAQR